MKLQTEQTIVFIGDSITDCGRRMHERPLGNGYVKQFNDLLITNHPQIDVNIINRGISGDTVVGLRNRWQDDVIRNRPDWLSIKIGINDLHKALRKTDDAVPPELYREAYNDILSRTKQELPDCNILLIDPFYISTETSPTSFRTDVLNLLPDYLKVVEDMSKKYKTEHIKTHDLYQKILKYKDPNVLCPEPVHPNLTGHLVMAKAVFNTLAN